MKNTVLFLLIIIAGFFACNKIDEPFKKDNGNNPIDTTSNQKDTVIRKILIEDFTGHKCGNCPEAHDMLNSLHNTYGDQIISIGIHADYFAQPDASGLFTADYRCQTGDELFAYFNVVVQPIGTVNRTQSQGSYLFNYTDWPNLVADMANDTATIKIDMENNYDASSNSGTIKVNTIFLQDLQQQLMLSLYITEDSIVSPQMFYNPTTHVDTFYVHRHVLRGAINNTWGEQITASGGSANDTLTKSYNYTINTSWVETKCSIVAFVYDNSTLEVLQVEEIKVKE
ncbi:MAG: hypothetical protein Kow0068_20350 [Marinilabiliales bacterium]